MWAPAQAGAAPPTRVDFSLRFDGSDGNFSKICSFDVLIEVRGKTKVLALPTGTIITTAPGQTTTVTNLDTGEKLELNIPGTSQFDPETGEVVFLGSNLIIRSLDFGDVTFGLVYAKGRFTFVPGDGLTGVGTSSDICAALA